MIPHRIFKMHRSISSFAHCKATPCRRYDPRSLLPRFASATATQPPDLPADGSNAFQTKSRAMDGRLAHADADRRRRRPRGHARTECFSDHGGAFDPRFLHAVSPDSHQWRVGGDEDVAAASAYRTQPRSLCRAAWLVFRADADSAGSGG